MQDRKRILIISEANLIKTFIQPMIKKLKEETGVHFDCCITTSIDGETRNSLLEDFENVFANKYPKGFIKTLPKVRFFQFIFGLRRLARSIPDYDIVHIHYHHYYFAFITPIIRRKAKKFFLTFFGSDFNQISNLQHKFNQKTVNLVDGIFVASEIFMDKILTRYHVSKSKKRTGILIPLMNSFISFERFLLNHDIYKAKQLIGVQKKVITCGYNAAPIVRHEMIIDALNKIDNKLHDYQIIFPMTYGNRAAEMRSIVKEKLKRSPLDSLVLENFMTIEKVQALRLATDIFIHIQERDQTSSSMFEHLAAGSVVITGKWLPYQDLIDKGAYFISMESPEDLAQVLSQVLDNLEDHKSKSKVNRKIILEIMSWDSIKGNWYKCYDLEQIS
jgi:glycosyltransferase involved in cell wall biosynthesis